MAVALVVQLILEGGAGAPAAAGVRDEAAPEQAAHGEAAPRDQASSKAAAARAVTAPPAAAEPSLQAAKGAPRSSSVPGPHAQAEEQPTKKVLRPAVL